MKNRVTAPTWAEINLDNINFNLNNIRKLLKEDTKICTVLKANAYGHGSVEIAKFLENKNVDYFAVARLEEAIELRENNIKMPILCLGFVPEESLEYALENNITLTIYSLEMAKKLNDISEKTGITANIHIKIDTGMSRIGFEASEESIDQIVNISNLNNLYIIPIIESSKFIYKEIKETQFQKMYYSILNHKDKILGIRIGLTDVLGMYSIRRKREFCIYDNLIATSFIQDVINYLNREELDVPISAGVSELFNMDDEKIKNLYIKEIELDKFHGFVGKTVIHPKQVEIVQALSSITYEDYMDAQDIIKNYNSQIGVKKSSSGDKMNEYKPHYKWAKKIMSLAYIYGVLNKGVDYNELIEV